MNTPIHHPIAYHITFGTYATRLHGDPRGSVDRSHNNPNDPIIGKVDHWQKYERNRSNFEPVYFDSNQRAFIENQFPDVCNRGGWELHIVAAQRDHLHCLISTDTEGKVVRKLIKRWLGQLISERWSKCSPHATWWAKGGSVKWVWDQVYFDRVYTYIQAQRTTQ